ncbi:MAG: diguanylate cyclase [Candidatus Dormibacteria bacterium]
MSGAPRVLDLPSFQQEVLDRGTNLQVIAGRAAERAQAICGAERAVVAVADSDGLIHLGKAGTWPAGGSRRVGAAPDYPWRVPLGSAAQVCADTEADSRVDRDACRRLGARSLTTVRLRDGDVSLGAITVTSSQPHAFDQAQTEALLHVADEVTEAAVRARVKIEPREICPTCESALVASEAKFRRLFYENPQPMWVLDAETQRFLAVNDAAVDKYGYSAEEFAVLTITALWHDATQLAVDFNRARTRKTAFKARHHLRDGRPIDVEMTFMPEEFDGRPGILSIVNDVTERNRLEKQLSEGAFRDPLTGRPNRALFTERVGHALIRTKRPGTVIAVLFIDLDSFKTVNDSIGYLAGDEVLRAVAARLALTLRPGDTVARLSADEFAVLLEDIGQASDSLRVAARLGEAFQSPLGFAGGSLVIGLSIGVATSSTAQTSADKLLGNAELAMHAAKAGGGGRVEVFVPTMQATAAERLNLEQD